MSEVRELVEGTPMSPFVHVATGADFASPFANAGDQGLGYINSDVTLYLHRLPVTRWIGFDVVNHHASTASRSANAGSMTRKARSGRRRWRRWRSASR